MLNSFDPKNRRPAGQQDKGKPKKGKALAAAVFLGCAGVAPLALAPVFAQTLSFSSVRVEGNERVDAATILSYAGIGKGQPVSAGALNDAYQRINGSGLFETVEIVPQGGTLVIKVKEYPFINVINFEGNRRIKDENLATLVKSQSRRVFSPSQAEADAAAIAEMYRVKGRIAATVEPRIIRRDANRVDLVFEITEGKVVEIERLSFVGNRAFSDRRLRQVLETKQAGLLRVLIQRDSYVAERIEVDKQVLTDFYRSRGYVDFQILDVSAETSRERDASFVTFTIREGLPYSIGKVSTVSEIEGVNAADFIDVQKIRRGQTFNPALIDNNIARMENLALKKGLTFVRVEPRISRNERTQEADVTFAIVRGEKIFVERIDIEGNATTLDRVVRNQFRTVEGDPFNPRSIREAAERIRALGYFANADVNARQGSAPDQVVVDVNVVEKPTGSLSFGGNFSTDNGFALVASFAERNFLGRGQNVGLNISTGEQNRVFALNFAEPALLGRDLRFGLNAEYRDAFADYALYNTETFRLSPSLAFPVSENGRLSVSYGVEYTDITDVDDEASAIIKGEAALGGLWSQSVGYTYTYDTRREGIEKSSGYILRFGQEFGIGDSQYIRSTALASAETRVWGEDVLLRATVEGGHLEYTEGNSRVTDRFFMGGRVMRGFNPGGIGPRDAETDDALGGDTFAVARLEAEFPLGLPGEYGISGGAFIDYGSLWNIGNDYGAEVLYSDYTPRATIGLSLFWDTPIGPLRFNFTESLEHEEFDNPRAFDLTISSSF